MFGEAARNQLRGFTPPKEDSARGAGDSAIEMIVCHPLRGLCVIHAIYSWGSASLYPRLYAATRSAGSS